MNVTAFTVKDKVSEKGLDEIYNAIDALMKNECWNFLNELFIYWEMRVWRTDLDILLAYAIASCAGKSKLPARKHFMNTCMRIHTDSKLWKGLT